MSGKCGVKMLKMQFIEYLIKVCRDFVDIDNKLVGIKH